MSGVAGEVLLGVVTASDVAHSEGEGEGEGKGDDAAAVIHHQTTRATQAASYSSSGMRQDPMQRHDRESRVLQE